MDNSLEAEIILLNCQAMNCLDKPRKALRLLQEAEAVLLSENSEVTGMKNRMPLLAVTFNNLACYYKNAKQPNVALFYLNQALTLEMETFAEPAAIAATNLNICAIYSQLNKHKLAMKSALSAIKYLKGYENDDEISENVINSIVVANYNIGVEFEYLKKFSKAVEFYTKGYNLCIQHLSPEHPMAYTLSESLQNARKQDQSISTFLNSRREIRNHGKFSSQSMSPGKSQMIPESKIYQSQPRHKKYPGIVKKSKNKLKTHRLSLEPLPRDIEKKTSALDSALQGDWKFSNAIERLKLLIN